MEKRLTNQIQAFPTVFEVLTDNGKPSERVGRKATDLNPVRCSFHYLTGHGGWVAEVGFRPLLKNYRGASPCGWFQEPQGGNTKCAPTVVCLNGNSLEFSKESPLGF